MQIKLLAIFAFILLLLVILLLRIAHINIKSGKKYAKQVLSQENYDSQTLKSRRGEIQDKNGRLLAYSEKQYFLVLDCLAINQKEEYLAPTVEVLNEVFGLSRTEMEEKITKESNRELQYLVVKRDVTQELKDAYEEYMDIESYGELSKEASAALREKLGNTVGIYFEENFIRKYPLNSVASQVVGFANDLGGAGGIEAYYDTLLSGTDGRVFGYLNDNEEYQKRTIAPQNGYTVQMTLDLNIQEVLERYIKEFDETYGDDLDNGTAKHGAKNIGVVVMDPDDGSILGMATNHSYDLNNPSDISAWYTVSEEKSMSDEELEAARNEMWGNFCIKEGFEPGSTFKPITVSSALECGAITENDGFTCDSGEMVTDTYIKCDVWPNAHGAESLGDVLKNSCNDGLMAIGAKMRVSRFLNYQSLFNFGKKTGIDLPGESTGIIYTREKMNEVELATCSFGQGFTCTMVQEIAAFSAVVNGGYYYQPHVMDKILDENGRVIQSASGLLLKQPISSRVSELLRGYLEIAVDEGTGSKAKVPGYRIGGKTGTAEKIDPETGTRARGKYLVSFIGAAPINDPEVVIYVVVDEPNVADQAHSTYAQEIYRKIATEVFPYMGIYPTETVTDAELAALGLTRADVSTDAVQYFQAYDSYKTLHNDAHIVDGQVVSGSGVPIEGAWIDDDGQVYDAYSNPVFKIENYNADPDNPDPKAKDNNLANPPVDEGGNGEDGTVWDGTALDEEQGAP